MPLSPAPDMQGQKIKSTAGRKGREERPGVASDTALEPGPPDISFKMSSPSPAPAVSSSLLEAGGDPGGCCRGAFLTHCSGTVTLRDTASLRTWDQDSPQVGRKSLGPVGQRNEVCGSEKGEAAEATAANGHAVRCFNSTGISWSALRQNFYSSASLV